MVRQRNTLDDKEYSRKYRHAWKRHAGSSKETRHPCLAATEIFGTTIRNIPLLRTKGGRSPNGGGDLQHPDRRLCGARLVVQGPSTLRLQEQTLVSEKVCGQDHRPGSQIR